MTYLDLLKKAEILTSEYSRASEEQRKEIILLLHDVYATMWQIRKEYPNYKSISISNG